MFRVALSRSLANAHRHHAHAPWVRALASLPDHKLITMPALSPTMEVGTIQEWKKQEGDQIEGGEVLAEIETDKATRSYEYNDDGFVAKVFIEEGATDVPVGKPLAIIVEEESHIAAFADYVLPEEGADAATPAPQPDAPAPPTPSAATPPMAAAATLTPAAPRASGERLPASPLARLTADSAGVALSDVEGTGPGGRIIAADVAAALAQRPAIIAVPSASAPAAGLPAYSDVDVSVFQRVTAKRLLESKQTVPHYYLNAACAVDGMLAMRARLNARAADGEYKISVNDFVIKAAAAALRKVPQVNAQWLGDKVRMFHAADICVAVQTERGLITPIVKDADRKGLVEISTDVKHLAGKAKDNTLELEEFDGGTFTISNLGMYGVSNFSAIVNPPQAAILAVGTTEKCVVPDDSVEAGFSVKTILSVTLSCDHRVVDGAIGAQWVKEFKSCLEDPVNMIM